MSFTAMYTGLSGMNANAKRLDVIGNNIANANTTAFKSSRMLFSTQFSETMTQGTKPDTDDGGSNPLQIGLGVQIAATQRDFTGGTIAATGDPRDLAIQGTGFYVVNHGGMQMYTRAGSFRQDASNDLVDPTGSQLLGYGVDSNFNVVHGALQPLNIPLGDLKIAQATKNMRLDGNLKSDGDAATTGASVVLGGSPTAGLGLIPSATVPPGPGHALETRSLLTEIADPLAPTAPLFAAGQSIQVRGAEKGNRVVPTKAFPVTATSTVQDFMDFLTDTLGVNSATGANPNGPTPGLSLDAATGKLTITGNTGTVNDLEIDSTDFQLLDGSGNQVRSPFDALQAANANGESVRTGFEVYDSLGNPVDGDVSMVLQSKTSGGTTWRYYVDSPADSDPSPNVATGVLQFDTSGALTTTTPVDVKIDRANTGADPVLDFKLAFADSDHSMTALASQDSLIAQGAQDGASMGTLEAFGVGSDGVIVGSFSNGATRNLGQVALATFENQEGLVDAGDNLFRPGANSGDVRIAPPGDFGSGQIVGGALEQSNVDLGQEFINMIQTSTGYTASSRVVRTADELLQQLMVLGR